MMDLSALATASGMRLTWDVLTKVPGGNRVFSKLLGRMAPYTGTIDPVVVDLRPGFARVQMRDRRAVRNHLDSIHAIALMNLAEVSSGVAMMASIPDDARGILTGLSIRYGKKARGLLTAECTCEPPATSERREVTIEAVIRDESGAEVARAQASWLIGPKKR